ncbi:acetyl-CoA carboxylase biotin carboxyl carrier protein [Novosphingobium mangrovi (ex Huang et al. 2023)]|uniref:Biotin carboxyl carrier protein of acetyl-CoA carboxylase n=1 Tax=Novosphingobium mangrovi (ex Huang et al. 2023) TaxID=2976432 RepID=A0ABT2I3C9_9SPHN|nr:acetyl-CoA carboxylase biotin carboxyl carrier protein [Novosphingobium mangrovi (ex Huang et al. 2023)]MCT2399315.1 acetyl-CoA carboxylase biotin carboxyl carrier protein [Novosphingobium mangrovi (ex Huang et al. 2023)]
MTGKNELTDIEQLLAEFEASDLAELQVRHGDFEIYLSKDSNAAGLGGGSAAQPAARITGTASPVIPAQPAENSARASAPAPAASDIPDGAVLVKAPYLGTFYRAPKPGAPSFVEVGQAVSEETELCLVEVMKLFTAVRAGVSGTIHAVLADDGAMVAADQPLFVVVPA